MFYSTHQGQKSQSGLNSHEYSNYSNLNHLNQKNEGKNLIGKEMKFRLHMSTIDIHLLDIIPKNNNENMNKNNVHDIDTPTYHELLIHSEEMIISTILKSEISNNVSNPKVYKQKESKLSISVALCDIKECSIKYDVKECSIRYDLNGSTVENVVDSMDDNLNNDDDRGLHDKDIKDDTLPGSDESLNQQDNTLSDPLLSLTPLYTSRPLFNIDDRRVIQTIPFLSFQSISDKYPENHSKSTHRTVIFSPHMDIIITFPPPISPPPSTSYTSQAGFSPQMDVPQPRVLPPIPGVSLVVNLEPLIISVHLSLILRWKVIFDRIMSTLPPANSHTKMSMVLVISSVDIYAHCDDSNVKSEEEISNFGGNYSNNDHMKNEDNDRTYIRDLIEALGLGPDGSNMENNDMNKWITIQHKDERSKDANHCDGIENRLDNVRVISNLDYEHQSSSIGGIHIHASQLLINVDTNNYSTKIRSNMSGNNTIADNSKSSSNKDSNVSNTIYVYIYIYI
jgi:hypothetical protein